MVASMSARRKPFSRPLVAYIILAFFAVVVLFPVYWMMVTSVKPNQELYTSDSPLWVEQATLENYQALFQKTRFLSWIGNSLAVACLSTLISVVLATLAAYSLSRLEFTGRINFGRGILFSYLIPSSLLFVPLYSVIKNLGLIDSLGSLILTYPTFLVPFSTWLLVGYFRSIPREIEGQALVDGCGRLGALCKVILPLALPGIIATAILCFTLSWSEFIYSLVFINAQHIKTIPVGVASLEMGDVYAWGQIMAAAFVSCLPILILYVSVQKYLLRGFTLGLIEY